MKILHVSESAGWGGGATQIMHLCLGLRERGFDVLLACPEEGELSRRARNSGFTVRNFSPFQDYDLRSAFNLSGFLARENVDIVHTHHSRAHAVALASMYFLGIRRRNIPALVVTRRVSFPIPSHVFSRFKYRSPMVRGYIAVADSIREILAKAGVRREKIVVIHSGVDLSQFYPRPPNENLRKEFNLPAGVPVVAKIANYGTWKGQDVFLRAALESKKRGLKAIFLLVGRDTQGPEARQKIVSLGLEEDTVRLLGFRTDVSEILSLVDVSVNSAMEGEGISGALRESLTMGIPVIASDVGGNREIVRPGGTGELFPKGDWAALAEKIIFSLTNRERARAMASTGRDLVRREYTIERMAEKTMDFYKKIVGQQS